MDVWGKPQQVTQENLLAVLEALTGRSLSTSHEIDATSADIRNDLSLIEPVVIAWDGHLPPVSVRGPVASAYLVTETGDELPVNLIDNTLRVDAPLPLGYHEIHLSGAESPTLVIAAPTLAHPIPRRELGVVAPVYSMRSSSNDTGIGNFGHLEQLADAALVTGASVVGTLPLVATFPDQPSPYSPASRRAWNEILVDMTAAPGWSGTPPVSTSDPMWVDYDVAGNAMRQTIADYTAETHALPQIRTQVIKFGEDNPETMRYARFRATSDSYGRNWRDWPNDATPTQQRIDYHLTAQWLATEQLSNLGHRLRQRGQYLYLDLPIGCHADGFDIWDQPDLYARAGVGAPPDSLFLGGQDWGLPATIPAQSRLSGHRAYIKAVRHQLSVAGLLRIDHVMGLHRMWWVPHGLAATEGAYVMQPTQEMFAIVCLESHRAKAAVIGENLGTVPAEIRDALDRHQLAGMKVAQDGMRPPASSDLIALSTHDTPPFAAWWQGTDIDDGEDLGVYTDGRGDMARNDRIAALAELQETLGSNGLRQTRDALMGWMAESDAAIAVINVDDLWDEERRQNVPGTDTERPNWRARHLYTMEEISADTQLLAKLERLGDVRKAAKHESDLG